MTTKQKLSLITAATALAIALPMIAKLISLLSTLNTLAN